MKVYALLEQDMVQEAFELARQNNFSSSIECSAAALFYSMFHDELLTEEFAERALKTAKGEKEVAYALAARASALMVEKRMKEAVEVLNRSVETYETQMARKMLASCYMHLHDFTKSFENAERAYALLPSVGNHALVYLSLFNSGRLKEAFEESEKALKEAEGDDKLIVLGDRVRMLFTLSERQPEVLPLLRKETTRLILFPVRSDDWVALKVRILLSTKQANLALEVVEEGRRLFPESWLLKLEHADVLFSLGEKERALELALPVIMNEKVPSYFFDDKVLSKELLNFVISQGLVQT